MMRTNLDLWQDKQGIVCLSYWDYLNGDDRHLVVWEDGPAYRITDDGAEEVNLRDALLEILKLSRKV
jgi:hypothetical protein